MQNGRWGIAALVAGSVALVGCASKVDLKEPTAATLAPVVDAKAGQAGAAGTAGQASGTAQSAVASVDLTAAGARQGAAATDLGRFVYFDFDSYTLRDEFKPLVDGHAARLQGQRTSRLVVEGHTDERGGTEYNLALGQRRAEAVARSLVLLGADRQQIEAVSFGEERPKAQGSDEAAMAQNRRAELRKR